MNKKTKIILAITILILVAAEIFLRIYGFCEAPLYRISDKYEYMAVPNQEGVRFFNHYKYNSYSQRSDEPDSTKIIILGLGDSVIFGGVQTDQKDLATSIFTAETGMQMLNISAGSWGPDNCAAYLKEKGLFGARAMFLLVSSHDAHDNMNFQPVVGVHPSYPERQYKLAIVELMDRYVLPRVFKKKNAGLDPDQKVAQGVGIKKGGLEFNPGFDELKTMADNADIPLVVYLHADVEELRNGSYNEQGIEIVDWAKKNNVTLIKELDYNFTEEDYRDGIHINDKGQRKLANIMEKVMPKYIYK